MSYVSEEKIKELIEGWYQKSRREQDEFSKFFFLWICFNAWLDHQSEEETDSRMIGWLVDPIQEGSDFVVEYERAKRTPAFIKNLRSLAGFRIGDTSGRRDPVEVRNENDFEGFDELRHEELAAEEFTNGQTPTLFDKLDR